jgi:hypothetical protein
LSAVARHLGVWSWRQRSRACHRGASVAAARARPARSRPARRCSLARGAARGAVRAASPAPPPPPARAARPLPARLALQTGTTCPAKRPALGRVIRGATWPLGWAQSRVGGQRVGHGRTACGARRSRAHGAAERAPPRPAPARPAAAMSTAAAPSRAPPDRPLRPCPAELRFLLDHVAAWAQPPALLREAPQRPASVPRPRPPGRARRGGCATEPPARASAVGCGG